MTFAFVSCYLSVHQVPICEELYRQLGNNFHYISVDRVPEWRLKSGYRDLDLEYPFVIRAYEDEKKALDITESCDVLMIGSAPDKYIKKRLSKNKLTIRCSERLYKNGVSAKLFPKAAGSALLRYHIYRNKRLYMLCASAYTAVDCLKFGCYKGKMFKWGYFPETIEYDYSVLLKQKEQSSVNILWVGRLIDWKHPEMAIEVADYLRKNGIAFQLKIVGTGEMETTIVEAIKQKKLDDAVHLVGAIPVSEVRHYMEQANIFLFTSDKKEGWGAVVNEAMNSGCAVIGCDAAGSVPFLIQDGVNGLSFHAGDQEQLNMNIEKVVTSPELCRTLGKNAYRTITNEWNAKVAVNRLLELVRNDMVLPEAFVDGPCSIASIIYDRK